MNIIYRWIIIALTIFILPFIVSGISVSSMYTALVVAVALALVTVVLKPILFVLTLPITILTLGLFTFVINALLLWLVSTFVKGFSVSGFWAAFLGALIVSAVNALVSSRKSNGVQQ